LHGRTFQLSTIPALLILGGSSLHAVNPGQAIGYKPFIAKNLLQALLSRRLPG
jgi:hypothetical protein